MHYLRNIKIERDSSEMSLNARLEENIEMF